MFNDQFSRTSDALSRANRLLNRYYKPSLAYDSADKPELDTAALRKALHAALAALDDEDGGADEEPNSSFTQKMRTAKDRELGQSDPERNQSTHVAGKRKDGDFTRQSEDSALAMDALGRQQRARRASMRQGAIDAEMRSVVGGTHRVDWR